MDLDHLRYFVAVARAQHLGRAAVRLGRSEAALSRAIARLEEHYGVTFFERQGRGLRLNPQGQIFLDGVERALGELDRVRRDLVGTVEPDRPPIALGFYATLGSRAVPHLIRAFQREDPAARFRLLQGPAPVLEHRLLDGEIDLCLNAPSFATPEIEWEALWSEEIFAVLPARHALAATPAIDLAELAEEPFVALSAGYGLRGDLERFCREAGFVPRIAYESEEFATARGLVAAGLGVTLGPAAPDPPDGTVLTRIRRPRCLRTFVLSWRRGRRLPPATAAFRDFVRSTTVDRESFVQVSS